MKEFLSGLAGLIVLVATCAITTGLVNGLQKIIEFVTTFAK